MRAHAAPTESPSRIPRHLWCSVAAVTSAMIGVHWDISWHRSIGRDTFFTAPHIAIYLCGVLGGIAAGWLILTTTFGPPAARASSVRVFGFRGPLGAFILAWGGVAMLTSAPFDDWWHNAYGLDVKIVSPPHILLGLGMLAVQVGALLLALGYLNRADAAFRRRLTWIYLYVGGMILVMMLAFLMEYTDRSNMHTGEFYRDLMLTLPLLLVGVARAAEHRWATTIMAGVFTLFQLALLWILPRFAAVPKLGPVYYPVTHFIPPPFPILIIVPAIAMDLVRARWPKLEGWRAATVLGGLFLGLFFVAQWPFAIFLQSQASRNWIFGTGYFDYSTRPMYWDFRGVFSDWETRRQFWTSLATAAVMAVLLSRLGLGWGNWMRRIRR